MEDEKLPDGVRPLGYILSKSEGKEYRSLDSLANAKHVENAVLIMEGDWGGQIYLTAPLSYVKCSERALQDLLENIDSFCWRCNELEGAGSYFEVRFPGEEVPGGMGGGEVINGVWVHGDLAFVKEEIVEVLNGSLSSLPPIGEIRLNKRL